MLQHWEDKHNKEHLRKITQDTSDEVQRLGRCVEEAKRQKLQDDRKLLQDQQSKKIELYDTEEAKTKVKLAARDMANAQKQEEQRLEEQQSRADFDNAAQEMQHIGVSGVRYSRGTQKHHKVAAECAARGAHVCVAALYALSDIWRRACFTLAFLGSGFQQCGVCRA